MIPIKIKNPKEDTKKCVERRKYKFEDYKHCLEAIGLKNKTNLLQKNKLI